MAAKPKHGLDIFEVLSAIDKHDVDFLSRQPEEKTKAFAPPVVMRWASAVEGPRADWYLVAINERANMYFYDIWKEPELQYRLIASCGFGARERHQWIAGKKSGKQKQRDFVAKYWPDANELEIDIILQGLSNPITLDETLSGMGLQSDDIKDAKKIFKD